jgi:hypothetical protein
MKTSEDSPTMETNILAIRPTPADAARWWAMGLWIRLALVGALAVPTGLVIALDGKLVAGALTALVGALAAAGFGARLKRGFDEAESTAPARASAPLRVRPAQA